MIQPLKKPDLPLPHVAHELRRQGVSNVTYSALYKGVLNGDVPAHQVNGRWFIRPDDLPRIAEILALPRAA